MYGDAGDAVEKRGDAALVGDDDGCAGGNRFGGGVAEILVLGGEDEDVGVSIGGPFSFPGKWAGEMDARGEI